MHMLLSEDICTVRWPDIPEQLFPGNSSCGYTEQMFLPKKVTRTCTAALLTVAAILLQVARGEICPSALLGHTQTFTPKQQLHKVELCK